MNLPKILYEKMRCVDEEEVFASEEFKNEIEGRDRYKYRTFEIIAHIYPGMKSKTYRVHHYKISFRNIYRINAIGFTPKIILGISHWLPKLGIYKLGNYVHDVKLCKIISHIRKYNQLEPINYDLYKSYTSGQSAKNIPNKSKRFLKNQIGNIYSRGVDLDDIETTEFTFTCRDLHSEELDKLIYPNEYLDKKYLEF